jgi:hypothetical protein
MVLSYGGTLLDHLAEHMVYLSTASSFWFSLNSSYDHEFHLSNDWVCPQSGESAAAVADHEDGAVETIP